MIEPQRAEPAPKAPRKRAPAKAKAAFVVDVDPYPLVYRHGEDWIVVQHSPRTIAVPVRRQYAVKMRMIPCPWMVYLWSPAPAPARTKIDVPVYASQGRPFMKIFARKGPLTEDDETLYYPHLPHVWRDCQPCGAAQGGAHDPFESIDMFWNTAWMDTGGYYLAQAPVLLPPQAPQGINQLEKFHPNTLLEWDWKPAGAVTDLCTRTRGH